MPFSWGAWGLVVATGANLSPTQFPLNSEEQLMVKWENLDETLGFSCLFGSPEGLATVAWVSKSAAVEWQE